MGGESGRQGLILDGKPATGYPGQHEARADGIHKLEDERRKKVAQVYPICNAPRSTLLASSTNPAP